MSPNPDIFILEPKWIYGTSKKFKYEKNGEISRNLRFSLVFVPPSKSDTHHGWDSWTRTNEMQESKSCALTDLAIPHNGNIIHIFLTLVNRKTSYSFSVNLKIE